MTPKRDDEVVNVEDEDKDVSEKTVAPQEVQGNDLPQLEKRRKIESRLPPPSGNFLFYFFCNFYFNLRAIWVPCLGTYDTLIFSK